MCAQKALAEVEAVKDNHSTRISLDDFWKDIKVLPTLRAPLTNKAVDPLLSFFHFKSSQYIFRFNTM